MLLPRILQTVFLVCVSGSGARSRWKALKEASRLGAEETETLLRSLRERIEQIHNRRHTLTQLVQELHNKVSPSSPAWMFTTVPTIHCNHCLPQKQHCEELSNSLQKAQDAVQACNHRLTQLRAESEATLGQLVVWQRVRDK